MTSISPSSGPTAGGTYVTILGSDLTDDQFDTPQVDFGGMPASYVYVYSQGDILAESPAGAASTVDVTVVTPGGASPTTSADQFTYVPPPVVTGTSPDSGPVGGGTTVTI